MASQQDGPPVDEGPIPFFSGPDDKDPFGSLHQAAAPPQPKQTLPPKQESAPNAGMTTVGDASALFGSNPAENQPIFSPSKETYQPAPAIEASPFGGPTYSGSNNDSFFDQANPSSFFDAPAQAADVTSQQHYGHNGTQHGDQQVPNYGTPLQQGYNQHDAYQQVPSADQSYDQQQYDQGPSHSHQQPAGYSYEQENMYSPHNQQPNDAYDGYTHSAYDPAAYQQPQQQASYESYGQHNQEQPPASHDPYAPQDHSTPEQQQQLYDPSTYVNQQQSYPPQQKEQSPVIQDAYASQSYTAPEQQPYDPSAYFNQQQSHPPQQTGQHDQQQQQYDPAAYSEHHQQQYDPEAYSEHQQSYDPSQQQQFDPNVHYYYDEAGQVHYYDPNTNQEYDFSQYDYSQQYSYDPNHAETGAESLDKAHVQDQQEGMDSFEPPVQDYQAGQQSEQFGDVAPPHTESAEVPVSHEEPISQYVPTQFSQPDNGQSYFDQGDSYNPDVEDNFVTETTPDTGDLDDLVLGEQSAYTPPPANTAAPPPSAVSPPPKAAPSVDEILQPSEETTTAPAEFSVTEDEIVPEVAADESGEAVESSFNEYYPQDVSPPQKPIEDPSSLMSSLNLPPQSYALTEQPAEHEVDPQESTFRRDSTRSSHHENAAMDMHASYPPVSQYTPSEPPRSIQSSLSPPPSLSAFSLGTQSINSPGLFPCPDPECQGENPSKAKFCCECGRQLAALSRAPTPAVSGQQPNRAYSNDSSAYFPQGDGQTLPQSYVPSLPNQHIPRSGSPLTTVSTPHDPYTSQGYYGTENYDPYQQQQYGNNDQQYAGQYDEQYNQQYDEQYNQQYDQQYADQQYGDYGMVDQPAEAEPEFNDPLNRSQGCPIAVFGFGGKLCLMFPHTVQRYGGGYGTDNSFAPPQNVVPGDVKIRNIKDVLTTTDSNTVADLTNFIGPLFMDSKVGSKAKKKDALKYTGERVESLKAQIQYLQGDKEKMFLESRILLWRVVQAALEIDGPLVDNVKFDESIRNILFATDVSVKDDNLSSFTVPADGQQTTGQIQDSYNVDLLETLQGHLMRGDREAAVRYAVQEDLWAHALIISSCVNKDLWKEVINGFVERELSSQRSDVSQQPKLVQGDRQGLRVLYALFAGQGAKAISELVVSGLHGFNRPASAAGSFYPNHSPTLDTEKLSHWQDTLALILANRTPRDIEAMTALGDILRDSGLDDAAQICYLASPQTSVHAGIDTPNVRLTLIGSSSMQNMWHDIEAIHLTELWEFAAAAKQPSGSQGLPFLQGYKLVLAWILADHGYIVEAQRYCEAMAGILKAHTKGSPYLHKHLLEKLKELNELCEMSGHGAGADSATSWLKQKIPKPTLDSIWGSLEGKFNKFVSGEDLPVIEPESRKSTEIVGSSMPESSLPARSASAVDMRYNNGASADWSRRATTPQSGKYGMRPISPGNQFGMGGLQGFSPLKTEDAVEEENASSLQVDSYRSTPNNESAYSYGQQPPKGVFSPFGQIQADTVNETQTESYQSYQPYGEDTAGGGWWSGSANDMAADTGANIDSNQYNTPVNSYEPQQSYEPASNMTSNYEDDDLGLGNSSAKKDRAQPQDSVPPKPTTPAPEKSENEMVEKKEAVDKQEPKGGWGLFSMFSRSNTSTPTDKKSVRANLGEENSFYYDKELKRWVNKKAGPDSAPSSPAPPPPRSNSSMSNPPKSASPAQALAPPVSLKHSVSSGGPPPPPPTGGMQRATSVPAPGPPPGVPSPAFSTPPPPSGTGAGARRPGAGRKPMRSRYIDVFNQPQQ